MKNKFMLAIMVTAVLLIGCSKDYTDQIKTEIDGVKTDSLSEELVKVNELYDKYDEMRMNAQDQTSINSLSKWGTLVWKEETISLLDRIKETDYDYYDYLKNEYSDWEKCVPSMAERMSYSYKDGSIYPTIYSYNEAMRYKQKAYSLASVLADIINDETFSFPDSTICGYYGDYDKDCYLIITEGMESDSYEIYVHLDEDRELHGWGYASELPDYLDAIEFTSDDDTVKGIVNYSTSGADFYVSEAEESVVEAGMTYRFNFRY